MEAFIPPECEVGLKRLAWSQQNGFCIKPCATGEKRIGGSCEVCPAGQYNFEAGPCHTCPRNAVCKGMYDVKPKPGYWQGPPYYQSIVSGTTADVLRAKGVVASHAIVCERDVAKAGGKGTAVRAQTEETSIGAVTKPPAKKSPAKKATRRRTTNHTSPVTQSVELVNMSSIAPGQCSLYHVNSSQSMIDQLNGQARVYRCPGGETACPDIGCAPGYHGPACALCMPGWAFSTGHVCKLCPESKGSLQAGVIAMTVTVASYAYYKLLAWPLFGNGGESWYTKMKTIAAVSWCANAIFAPASRRVGPFIAALRDRAPDLRGRWEFFREMLKILLTFVQIIGSLLRIDLRFPKEFDDLMEFFSLTEFSIDIGSLACLHEARFYDKLLGNTLVPFGVLLVMAFPTLYARLVQHKHTATLLNIFIGWSLVLFNIIYPTVRSLLHMPYAFSFGSDGMHSLGRCLELCSQPWPVMTLGRKLVSS